MRVQGNRQVHLPARFLPASYTRLSELLLGFYTLTTSEALRYYYPARPLRLRVYLAHVEKG